jgi:hypothetical protein
MREFYFFWVFKGGAQEVKVILQKCKGGDVAIIYIYRRL